MMYEDFISVLYELLFIIIFSCFDQFFDLYLVHLDKGLREQMTNRLIGDFTVNKSSFENRDLGDVFRDGNMLQIGEILLIFVYFIIKLYG